MKFIQNQLNLSSDEKFVGILGVNPSSGARSPYLWNAVLSEKNLDIRMHPMDVAVEDVKPLLSTLAENPLFLGGAVTVPHKETVAQWLGKDRLTEEAYRIGAVNCLYRNPDGVLCGTNTDGEAALKCFSDAFGAVSDKNVLQLGCGGAGKATAAYFSAAQAKLTIAVRDRKKIKDFAQDVSAEVIGWDDVCKALNLCDIVINTTNLGFSGTGNAVESPLLEDEISLLHNDAVVYDVIYDPFPTLLLNRAKNKNLKTMGGGCMNLEQAVLGFMYSFPDIVSQTEIRNIMTTEKSRQGW